MNPFVLLRISLCPLPPIPLQKITYGTIDYTPGKRDILYLNSLNLHIQPLVCYESVFSEQVRIMNSEADLIVNITNDAWYGNSSGPYQHFSNAKFRSVESGLPVIRSSNKGISAIIDPYGREIKKLSLNGQDVITLVQRLLPPKQINQLIPHS